MATRTLRRTLAILLAGALVAASCSNDHTTTTPAATDASVASVFDDAVVHDIDVTFVQADYDGLIEAYRANGEKEWIAATVTIDGSTYENVGLRLKGNSSLMGLRGTGAGGAGGPGGEVSVDEPQTLPWLVRLDKYVED
jgi:spore coat protein CotH